MIYRFNDTSVDTLRAEIRRRGETVPLRRKSFDVLIYLLQRPRRVVTKRELLNAVWSDKVVTEGSLKSCLTEIRAAIGDLERKLIRTVPRRGYMFEAPLRNGAKEGDTRKSILVLPLECQGVEEGSGYLGDGITNELITELSRSQEIRVISRASAMKLKGAETPMPAVARDLGVDYVLQGILQTSEQKLRVSIQLVHVESESVDWSERYTGSVADLFAIQDEITESLGRELAAQLSSTEPGLRGAVENPLAIESYFRARSEVWKFSENALCNAERHLLNGLELVGPNVRLLSALGHTYSRFNEIGLDPTGSYMQKASDCADRIFAIEPESTLGLSLVAMVRFHSGELRAAFDPLAQAVSERPSDPDMLMMLGYLYALRGQNKRALSCFEEAMIVDPLTPIHVCMPGFVAIMEGRNADALPHYRRFLQMDPHNPFAVWAWAYVLLRNSRIREASDAIDDLNGRHSSSIMAQVGTALYRGACGDKEAALEAVTKELRAAAKNSELLSRELTHCLALAGRIDDALDWLENTIRLGNINYPFWSSHNQWIEPLRTNPRFTAIMRDVEDEWRAVCKSPD